MMKDGYLTGDALLLIGIVYSIAVENWWLLGIVVAIGILKSFE